MDNILPIIGLVAYFILTGLLRKRKQDQRNQMNTRKQRPAAPPPPRPRPTSKPTTQADAFPDPYTQRYDSNGRRQRMSDLNSIFANMAEKLNQIDDETLPEEFSRPVIAEDTDWELEEDEIKIGEDITDFEESQTPIDTAEPAGMKIDEGESVFDESMSDIKIGAYATKHDSYKIKTEQRTVTERLEARLAKHSFFEKGIIYAEVIGPPLALRRQDVR